MPAHIQLRFKASFLQAWEWTSVVSPSFGSVRPLHGLHGEQAGRARPSSDLSYAQ